MTYTTLEIYCQDSSHDETRCPVETFAKVGPAEWVPLDELRSPGHSRTSQRINALTDSYLDPSAPLHAPVEVRDRYRLRCGRCPRTVTVRADRLGPVLDRLIAAGASDLSLEGLASILRC